MGTPNNISQELKVPTMAEKTQIIDIGREIGKGMKSSRFPEILEKMKMVLLPLVQWLDKPARDVWNIHAPHNKRAMLIFEVPDRYMGLPNVALERSGEWLIRIYDSNEWQVKNVSSNELAKLFLKREDSLLKLSLEGYRDISKYFIEKAEFMRNVTIYSGILIFVSKCFETIDQAIKERENRIRLMRERSVLFKDLVESLDPLLASGRTVGVPCYSIFSHSGHGASRSISDYFSRSAVEPFWKYLDSSSSGRIGYKEFVSSLTASSLPDLIQRIIWHVKEIWSAESNNMTEASSLFGRITQRLPFTGEETQILKEMVDSI